jgi:group II intron reverse transcriptase/maturase
MRDTERHKSATTKLARIGYLSAKDPGMKFGSLMHHFNRETLTACFHRLDRKKAVGVDGVNKDTYGCRLDANVEKLVSRMKSMSYRPGPARQVLIPKEGKPGATRPLGIGNLEDKLVQGVTHRILESIYEPLFRRCSYGFRPGRGPHDAVRDLSKYLHVNTVATVIDVDLENYFGKIDHWVLEGFLREKIADKRFLRYLTRMFKAGVLADGELQVSDEGVPQGSLCSPVLSNIMAHHVIDVWFEDVVRPRCKGKVAMFRYADDLVVCCQFAGDAERVTTALSRRLERFKLNAEKTRLISFSKRAYWKGTRQGTFDYLGFTFYLGRTKKGNVTAMVRTSCARYRSKLSKVATWIKGVRSRYKLRDIWTVLCMKLRGHIAYYAVSFNVDRVRHFLRRVSSIVFKWLNRRSQKKSLSWEQFRQFMAAYPLPEVRVMVHLF